MTADDAERAQMLVALDELDSAARDITARNQEIQDRIAWLRDRIAQGDRLVDLVVSEPRPLVVEMLTANAEKLQFFGSRFRQAEAVALRAEGLTIEAIAALFGVTRQRISALLKADSGRAEPTLPGS